jgi:hypothetical protein
MIEAPVSFRLILHDARLFLSGVGNEKSAEW